VLEEEKEEDVGHSRNLKAEKRVHMYHTSVI
jgi:hypothetical protein